MNVRRKRNTFLNEIRDSSHYRTKQLLSLDIDRALAVYRMDIILLLSPDSALLQVP